MTNLPPKQVLARLKSKKLNERKYSNLRRKLEDVIEARISELPTWLQEDVELDVSNTPKRKIILSELFKR